jgi:hypothetical protein
MFGEEANHSQNEGKKFFMYGRCLCAYKHISCTTSFYILKVNGRAVTRVSQPQTA